MKTSVGILDRLAAHSFARRLGVLMIGSLVGQVIYFLSTPFLTRLYEPSAFAGFALFMALVSAVSPAVAGRYEMALMVVRDQRESTKLLNLAVVLAAALSAVAWMVLVALLQLGLIEQFRPLDFCFHLAPAAIFMTAAISALRNFALAKHDHMLVAKFSIIQPVLAAAIGISLGWMGQKNFGLLLATFFSLVLTALLMSRSYFDDLIVDGFRLGREKFLLARRYKNFPLLSAPASLLDGLAMALPVMFLTKYYSPDIVGYYALITRVVMAPLNFISQSFSQLNVKQVATLVNRGENPSRYIFNAALLLLLVASAPALIFFLWGKPIFHFLFGPTWAFAGELITILLPSMVVRFVASTLSGAMISSGHLGLIAAWQVLAIVGTSAMFLWAGSGTDSHQIFRYIMLTDLLLYTIYFFLIVYSIKRPKVIN